LENKILSENHFRFLFFLLSLVYIAGLFVPLMDNDAAHHANIALHMYLTGDYVNLVDNGHDYLDKPHLHFWLSAFSYKIFGVNSFAYRFPSFLFTLLGTYSTFKLGSILYNKETGKLAALIVASAFGYLLANTDVRMDAILTACIIFSTWQGVLFINIKNAKYLIGTAIGLALGFCTKGHLAVLVPAVGLFFYMLQKKNLKTFIDVRWLLILLLFFIFISPVLYCYYLQFDLHPEKIIRGRTNISGVKFILWNQSFERFSGGAFGADSANDYFFFIHSLLWAFAPWFVLAFIAFIFQVKFFFKINKEWLTTGTFFILFLLITFSRFKLPHYLNVIFPVTAILTASFLLAHYQKTGWSNIIRVIQMISTSIILFLIALINVWAFPVPRWWVIIISVLLLAIVFYYMLHKQIQSTAKAIYISVATMILLFFLMNTNFYPHLLQYQAGNELAKKPGITNKEIYFWKDVYSSSFSFYTKSLRKELSSKTVEENKQIWVITDERHLPEIKKQFNILQQIPQIDYEITRLNFKFINPGTREKECTQLIILHLQKK